MGSVCYIQCSVQTCYAPLSSQKKTLENEYFSRIIFIIREIINKRIRGAMVARLTPDQKVACSIHVGFSFVAFIFLFFHGSYDL